MEKKFKKSKSKVSGLICHIKKSIKRVSKKRDKEYSKRLLNRIINHSMLMMWASYVLAWFGKVEIAETLSKTIATSVIAVVVGYLAKSVVENISKHTDTFGKNIDMVDSENMIYQNQEDDINTYRDC